MTRFVVVLLLAGLGWTASTATVSAQELAPPAAASEDSRYSFHRVKDGFVRLDGRTGQVSQCGWNTAGWSCTAVPDDRTALEGEIARLQSENASLKKSILARGLELPGGVKADPPLAKVPESEPSLKMPSEAEVDRALGFVKDVWKRLVEMMVELQRDIQRKS